MTSEELAKALRQAYNYGQTYWQQADSEYASQWKKADLTADKFSLFVAETVALAAPAAPVAAPAPSALTDADIDAIWQTMPGGPAGWFKSFGYQQFAREIEAAILDSADPFAGIAADFASDAMLAEQELPK